MKFTPWSNLSFQFQFLCARRSVKHKQGKTTNTIHLTNSFHYIPRYRQVPMRYFLVTANIMPLYYQYISKQIISNAGISRTFLFHLVGKTSSLQDTPMYWTHHFESIMIYGAPYKNLGIKNIFNTSSCAQERDDVVKASTGRILLEFIDKVLNVNGCLLLQLDSVERLHPNNMKTQN